MRGLFGVLCALALGLPCAGQAQDRARTLADIRQELTVLNVEVQRMRRELSTTGAPQVNTGGGSVLDRIAAIEAELQRLTGATERLEFRIDSIVRDGTNRIGDLEFRLVELEGGDVSTLGQTSTLGGETPAPAAPSGPAPNAGPQLAEPERADFESATKALADGAFAEAAEAFAVFNANYPDSPLEAAAHLGRGEALAGLGDTRESARAYLAAFSADQTGQTAPEALFRLGRALGQLGQTAEACATLGEVPARFVGTTSAQSAMAERARIGCS
ncbi:MAG: tol-pal system protein YbgF [Pseudomonadota bacterium]